MDPVRAAASPEHALPPRLMMISSQPMVGASLAAFFTRAALRTPSEAMDVSGEDVQDACVAISATVSSEDRRSLLERVFSVASSSTVVLVESPSAADVPELGAVAPDSEVLALGTVVASGSTWHLFQQRGTDTASSGELSTGSELTIESPDGSADADLAYVIAMSRAASLERELAGTRQQLAGVSAALERTRAAFAESTDKSRREVRRLRALLDSPLGRLAVASESKKKASIRAIQRLSPMRRRFLTALSSFVAVLTIVGAGILVGWLSGSGFVGGLIAAFFIVTMVAFAAVMYEQRSHRSALKALRTQMQESSKAQGRLARDARKRHVELCGGIQSRGAMLTALERDVALLRADVVEASHIVSEAQARQVDRAVASHAVESAIEGAVRQFQASLNLRAMLPNDVAIPQLGGWAASADVLVLLLERLVTMRPRLVVECGSGVSTLCLALAIRHHGLDCRVVALEHQEDFAEATRALLARHAVSDLAEVRLAPLQPGVLADHEAPWYSVDQLADLENIGLVFVDGPPELTGPLARLPAVPLLADRFADTVTIILDDLVRADEQEISRRWEEALPDFRVERITLEKNAAVFTRDGANSS